MKTSSPSAFFFGNRKVSGALILRRWFGVLCLITCPLTVKAGGAKTADQSYHFSTLLGAISAGQDQSFAVPLQAPSGVAIDKAGNIYLADSDQHVVLKVSATGVTRVLAGSLGQPGNSDGSGRVARFYYPKGVALDDAGSLYVADTANHAIRKISRDGQVSTVAGLPGSIGHDDGVASAARFYYPSGIATDRAGNVYVADTFNSVIRVVTSAGVVQTLAGVARSFGSEDGFGSTARFNYPASLTIDKTGFIYVADTGNQTIRRVTLDGNVCTLAGLPAQPGSDDGPAAAARFSYPGGVAADSAGNILVADTANQVIRKISPAGVVTTIAGKAGLSGRLDGGGKVARFHNPGGLAVDDSGNVYVADTDNHSIRLSRSPAQLASDPVRDENDVIPLVPDGAGDVTSPAREQSTNLEATPTPTPIPTTTETFAVADDGTPLTWTVYRPAGTGPWPVVLVITAAASPRITMTSATWSWRRTTFAPPVTSRWSMTTGSHHPGPYLVRPPMAVIQVSMTIASSQSWRRERILAATDRSAPWAALRARLTRPSSPPMAQSARTGSKWQSAFREPMPSPNQVAFRTQATRKRSRTSVLPAHLRRSRNIRLRSMPIRRSLE